MTNSSNRENRVILRCKKNAKEIQAKNKIFKCFQIYYFKQTWNYILKIQKRCVSSPIFILDWNKYSYFKIHQSAAKEHWYSKTCGSLTIGKGKNFRSDGVICFPRCHLLWIYQSQDMSVVFQTFWSNLSVRKQTRNEWLN